MAKYRIIKDSTRAYPYLIQKKFLGFLWWYFPFTDVYGVPIGHSTLDVAKEIILDCKIKRKREVVWEE